MEIYEEICDRCNGIGFIPQKNGIKIASFCENCYGGGTIDWVQKVVGIKFSGKFSKNLVEKRSNNIRKLTEEGYHLTNPVPRS